MIQMITDKIVSCIDLYQDRRINPGGLIMNEEPIYNRNIAKEWYQRGLKYQDDDFTRFMMYWIAFNWLYGEESGEEFERGKIVKYYKKHRNKFDKYDPFGDPIINCFYEGPIYSDKSERDTTEDFAGIKHQKATHLLLSIYQVRCNLFHGSKQLRVPRDQELVKASANILVRYLEHLVE